MSLLGTEKHLHEPIYQPAMLLRVKEVPRMWLPTLALRRICNLFAQILE